MPAQAQRPRGRLKPTSFVLGASINSDAVKLGLALSVGSVCQFVRVWCSVTKFTFTDTPGPLACGC
jgi:hypothetical protein